jgi:hypothetical protein
MVYLNKRMIQNENLAIKLGMLDVPRAHIRPDEPAPANLRNNAVTQAKPPKSRKHQLTPKSLRDKLPRGAEERQSLKNHDVSSVELKGTVSSWLL